MSIHISAKKGDIAPIVLMPGDPLRAKHISEMLENVTMVSSTRNAFYFTGTYKGVRVTIGASGMGCPSIGIYSHELYDEYEVKCIIRVGTAGAYTTDLKVYDLVNVDKAYSESTYARHAHGIDDNNFSHQGRAYELINEAAVEHGVPVITCAIHSSDVFYRVDKNIPEMASANNCLAVEMESFALFSNAKLFNRMAATVLTISDVIPTHEGMTADQRETSLDAMATLVLVAAVKIDAIL